MDDKELQALLMATFAEEAKENIDNVNTKLLELEKAPDADRVGILEEIFRDAHSLKGSARAVELADVERVAHHLESLFSRLRDATVPVTADIIDLTLRTMDVIATLIASAVDATDVDCDIDAAVAELEAASNGTVSPEPAAAAKTQAAPRTPAPSQCAPGKDETIRVSTAKLDALMAQVGELLAARIEADQRLIDVRDLHEHLGCLDGETRQLRVLAERLAADGKSATHIQELLTRIDDRAAQARNAAVALHRKSEAGARRLSQVISGLQDEVRRTRMLPCSTIFDSFPRLVRDLARDLGKEIELTVEGGSTEVDKAVLEQLKQPLTHMIRNSVDHGLETPADRAKTNKPSSGTVSLRASQRGANLILEVRDDGYGINPEHVKASALNKGLITAEQAAQMTDKQAIWLIFRSGFSTKQEVSDVSGRGVGMDVVREQVERLHGIIEVESELGVGTTFTLSLPVSVATTLCLFVRAGGEQFAFPIANVERILRPCDDNVGSADGQPALNLDGRPVALVDLSGSLGRTGNTRPLGEQVIVILASADRRAAMLVDEVIGAQESAVKGLPHPLLRVQNIAGATIVGSGEVVTILNAADLLRAVANGQVTSRRGPLKSSADAEVISAEARDIRAPQSGQRVMVVDDSMTIRTLEKSMLQAAGYEVLVASDGQEAWDLLQQEPVAVLISDVEMPNMNGFELTRKVRSSPKLGHLPVVLVTSLNSPEDQQRGVDAGADAYIVKGSMEQDQLLQTVKGLI